MGSGDIQSLADLGNSISTVRGMRLVPFGMNAVITLAVVTVAPLLPLMLTMFSFEELLLKVVKILL